MRLEIISSWIDHFFLAVCVSQVLENSYEYPKRDCQVEETLSSMFPSLGFVLFLFFNYRAHGTIHRVSHSFETETNGKHLNKTT